MHSRGSGVHQALVSVGHQSIQMFIESTSLWSPGFLGRLRRWWKDMVRGFGSSLSERDPSGSVSVDSSSFIQEKVMRESGRE